MKKSSSIILLAAFSIVSEGCHRVVWLGEDTEGGASKTSTMHHSASDATTMTSLDSSDTKAGSTTALSGTAGEDPTNSESQSTSNTSAPESSETGVPPCECKVHNGKDSAECDDDNTCAECGDGHANIVAGEECDNGSRKLSGNGSKNENGDSKCTTDCKNGFLRAFVTHETFTGNLGGIAGADGLCNEAAAAAGLVPNDRFVAWLATERYSAKPVLKSTCGLPYYLTDGTKLADGIDSLLAMNPSPLFTPLNIDENGTTVNGAILAWTCIGATEPDCDESSTCHAWNSEFPDNEGIYGIVSFHEFIKHWNIGLDAFLEYLTEEYCTKTKSAPYWSICNAASCNTKAHLYCFEKCPQ